MKRIVIFSALIFSSLFHSCAYCAEEEISEENLEKSVYYYKQGAELFKAKKYDEAMESCNQALKLNPKMTDVYYNIAAIHAARKNYDDAYNTYVKIIKLNPYDYDAVLQAAKISYNRKSYALAMKYLKLIPEDYADSGLARQMYADAEEMFNAQKKKIERAKITSAADNKKVLIDKFNSPAGIAADSEGNLYIACYGDNSIIKIDKNNDRSVFMKGYLLEGPIGLAFDEYDNLYAANYDGDNILKITRDGQAAIFMNKVSKPYFLYIKNDVLYISEQGNNVILKFNLASN